MLSILKTSGVSKSSAFAKNVVSSNSPCLAVGRASSPSKGMKARAMHATPYDGFTFEPITEAQISRAMTTRYFKDLYQHAETDVLIVGGGSAGLAAAYELSKHPDVQVTLIEQNVAPGGGAWLGGQLFSAMCIRKPAHEFLDELEIEYEDEGTFVVVKHAALVTSTLLSKVLAAPNVRLFNATAVEDLIVKPDDSVEGGKRVGGAVTNWTSVVHLHSVQSCMDPNTIESKVMISSTGHDGPFGASGVKRLAKLGMIESIKGMGALNMNEAEDSIVRNTKQVAPGIIMAGMEVSEWSGSNRMGPTFGAMFISGFTAAHLALNELESQRNKEKAQAAPREMAQV